MGFYIRPRCMIGHMLSCCTRAQLFKIRCNSCLLNTRDRVRGFAGGLNAFRIWILVNINIMIIYWNPKYFNITLDPLQPLRINISHPKRLQRRRQVKPNHLPLLIKPRPILQNSHDKPRNGSCCPIQCMRKR